MTAEHQEVTKGSIPLHEFSTESLVDIQFAINRQISQSHESVRSDMHLFASLLGNEIIERYRNVVSGKGQ